MRGLKPINSIVCESHMDENFGLITQSVPRSSLKAVKLQPSFILAGFNEKEEVTAENKNQWTN